MRRDRSHRFDDAKEEIGVEGMVWESFQHIEKIITDGVKQRLGICNKCGKNIKADTNIVTNSLKNHVA